MDPPPYKLDAVESRTRARVKKCARLYEKLSMRSYQQKKLSVTFDGVDSRDVIVSQLSHSNICIYMVSHKFVLTL